MIKLTLAALALLMSTSSFAYYGYDYNNNGVFNDPLTDAIIQNSVDQLNNNNQEVTDRLDQIIRNQQRMINQF